MPWDQNDVGVFHILLALYPYVVMLNFICGGKMLVTSPSSFQPMIQIPHLKKLPATASPRFHEIPKGKSHHVEPFWNHVKTC